MREDLSREKMHKAIDSTLSGLEGDPWLFRRVAARAGEGEIKVKKRLSAGLILVIVLILLSVSAGIATVSGWDVVRFLYGDRTVQSVEPPELDVWQVQQEVVSDGARFRVESAVYDGKKLAFDWYFENTKPNTPVMGDIEELTVNGINFHDHGFGRLSNIWLPSIWFEESFIQFGEEDTLPEELQGAENLHVYMKIVVYHPVKPVCQMKVFDDEELAARTAEGFLVITDPYSYMVYDPEEGEWCEHYCWENPPDFRVETMELTFDVPKGDTGHYVLEPRASYEGEHGTASYDVAAVTTGGLQLTLRMLAKDDAFSRMQGLVLTDGDGTPLEGDRFTPDVTYRVDTGDPGTLVFRYRWSRVQQKDLPDTISLTCILEDGEKLVFPVKVR